MWVHTGAALPEGADAVVMVEDTVTVGDMVEIRAQVYPGRNVGVITSYSIHYTKLYEVVEYSDGLIGHSDLVHVRK